MSTTPCDASKVPQPTVLDAFNPRLDAYWRALIDANSAEFVAFAKAFPPANAKEIPPTGLAGFRRTDDQELILPGFCHSRETSPEPLKLYDGNNSNKEIQQDPQVERAVISEEKPQRAELSPSPLDDLRHLLQTHLPGLYAQVLADTFADLRQEYSAALAEGHPLKARWILLRGCCALATAAACQLGSSLLGRIATLWQTRSLK